MRSSWSAASGAHDPDDWIQLGYKWILGLPSPARLGPGSSAHSPKTTRSERHTSEEPDAATPIEDGTPVPGARPPASDAPTSVSEGVLVISCLVLFYGVGVALMVPVASTFLDAIPAAGLHETPTAVFLVLTLTNFLTLLFPPIHRPRFLILLCATAIYSIAALNYALVATGVVPAFRVHGRAVLLSRYLEWTTTTPLMAMIVALSVNLPARNLLQFMLLDAVTMLGGLASHFVHGWTFAVVYSVSCVAGLLTLLAFELCFLALFRTAANSLNAGRIFFVAAFTAVALSLYPAMHFAHFHLHWMDASTYESVTAVSDIVTKVLLTNVFVEGSYVQHEEEVRVYKKIRAQARIERRLVLDFFANSLESSVSGIGFGLRQLEDLVDVLAEDSAAGLSPVSRARHFQRPSESISFLQYQLDATKRLVDDVLVAEEVLNVAPRTRTLDSPLAVVEVVRCVVREMQAMAVRRKITIHVVTPPDVSDTLAVVETHVLDRALRTLLRNAIRSGLRGSSVIVHVTFAELDASPPSSTSKDSSSGSSQLHPAANPSGSCPTPSPLAFPRTLPAPEGFVRVLVLDQGAPIDADPTIFRLPAFIEHAGLYDLSATEEDLAESTRTLALFHDHADARARDRERASTSAGPGSFASRSRTHDPERARGGKFELGICKWVLEAHGGRMGVTSVPPWPEMTGYRTCFFLDVIRATTGVVVPAPFPVVE